MNIIMFATNKQSLTNDQIKSLEKGAKHLYKTYIRPGKVLAIWSFTKAGNTYSDYREKTPVYLAFGCPKDSPKEARQNFFKEYCQLWEQTTGRHIHEMVVGALEDSKFKQNLMRNGRQLSPWGKLRFFGRMFRQSIASKLTKGYTSFDIAFKN